MEQSFYSAAVGAAQCTQRLSVIANNLANVNNTGFRPKQTAFSELVTRNLNDSEPAVTNLQSGVGSRLIRTYTSYDVNSMQKTNSDFDYAIAEKNAFFMLQDPVTGAISYTRDGHFHRSEQEDGFYLMTDSGKYVLDQNQEPLKADTTDVEKIQRKSAPDYDPSEDEDDDEDEDDEDKPKLSLYTFNNPSRLVSISANEYVPADEGVEATLIEKPKFQQRALESSGTDMAEEFSHLIECQRAFTYALRMVTTSDEVTSTINNLRG